MESAENILNYDFCGLLDNIYKLIPHPFQKHAYTIWHILRFKHAGTWVLRVYS